MKTIKTSSAVQKSKKKKHPFWSFFWLTFLVVSLWYAWYSFYVPTNNEVWTNEIATAKEMATQSEKNVMLFFTGKWCSPCRIMKREVFTDADVKKAIYQKVIPVEINIDEPYSKSLVTKYNIGATPTTLFVDSKGKVIDYAIGKLDKSKLLEMLQKI